MGGGVSMKIFYTLVLAAALFVLGCDNPVDDKPAAR